MDVENLISEVFIRSALWDKTNKNHHNRFVLDKMWNEVAQKTQTTQNIVRAKWKTLRDKFRITLASIPKPKSGDPQVDDYKGEWKYFKSLLFLKDQFTPRKSSGNLDDPTDPILVDDTEGDQDDPEEVTVQSPLSEESNRPVTPASFSSIGKPQHSKQSVGTALLQIEREKLEFLQSKRARKEDDDEDLDFFKSLLPHVRKLSPFDKMEYRMKVMKITQEFMKPPKTSFTSQTTGPEGNTLPATSNQSSVTRIYYDNLDVTLDLSEEHQLNTLEYTQL